MCRFVLFTVLLSSAFVQSLLAEQLTLRGFVTAVQSPTSFEIDKYKIIDENTPRLKTGRLRVGVEVGVKGEYDRKTGELRATEIKMLFDDSDPETPIEGVGLVEDKTGIQKTAQGWSGRLAADGETLVIAPDTFISVNRSRAERKELRNAGREVPTESMFSPVDIDLDTFAHYVGVRQADRSILAKSIDFRQDRGTAESAWKPSDAKVFYSDRKSGAGTVIIDDIVYRLFPSPEALAYLSKLANNLIPQHQRELPDKSPGKVTFRLFLTDSDKVTVDSYPNGVLIVSVHLFDVLDNEGQLAFMLAHEIARVVEKQEWTTLTYTKGERTASAAVAMAAFGVPGFVLADSLSDKEMAHRFGRGLQDQADRVGIEYMLAAGYDPKEAIDAWRVLDEKHVRGHFWGDPEVNLLRRSYLESELQLNYANRDFSSLKRDSPDFHSAVDAIKGEGHHAKVKRR